MGRDNIVSLIFCSIIISYWFIALEHGCDASKYASQPIGGSTNAAEADLKYSLTEFHQIWLVQVVQMALGQSIGATNEYLNTINHDFGGSVFPF